MEFKVLGPLEVVDDGSVVGLGSGRRALLAHCLPGSRAVRAVARRRPGALAAGDAETAAHRLREAIGLVSEA